MRKWLKSDINHNLEQLTWETGDYVLIQFPEKGMTKHSVENIFSKDPSSMNSKYNSTNATGGAVYLYLQSVEVLEVSEADITINCLNQFSKKVQLMYLASSGFK